MKKGIFVLTLMLLLALVIGALGCAEEETGPTPSATPTATLTPAPSPTALFLEITQPADGAEVSTSPINVTGKTIPGAVVSASIDDAVEMADVEQDGNFSVTVMLEEGPNFIEVIASDQQGNDKSSSIAVIYVP